MVVDRNFNHFVDWRGFRGSVVHWMDPTVDPVDVQAHVVLVQACSYALIENATIEYVVAVGGGPPLMDPYGQVTQAMVLEFSLVGGGTETFRVIGPAAGCFEVDTVTVDETQGDVAALIVSIIALCAGREGALIDDYITGWREERFTSAQWLQGSAERFLESEGSAAKFYQQHGGDVEVDEG